MESAITVNASLATGTLAASWRPIEMAAAELRNECTALDQLVQELFSDLDRVRSELELKADEVEEGRRRLAERGRQLADQRKEAGRMSQQLEQQDAQLREALGELRALREQLDRERQAHNEREQQQWQTLEQRCAQIEAERDDLRRQLETARAQVAGGDAVTPLLSEFAQLRQQLEAIQSQPAAAPPPVDISPLAGELAELRRSLESLQAAGQSNSGGNSAEAVAPLFGELAQLREHLDQTRAELSGAIDRAAAAREGAILAAGGDSPEASERFSALTQERAELEAELELVRTRALELQETVAQQKRELSGQRDELQAELKLLRQLIEQQSDLMASNAERPEATNVTLTRTGPPVSLPRPAARPVEEDRAPPADPVVSSVMAQFARLQKDVSQRRQKVRK
jgi:chromosome segregation ATPase